MRPEHKGIVHRLREQLRVAQTDNGEERLPRRWVELIVLLNERERARREQSRQSADSRDGAE